MIPIQVQNIQIADRVNLLLESGEYLKVERIIDIEDEFLIQFMDTWLCMVVPGIFWLWKEERV